MLLCYSSTALMRPWRCIAVIFKGYDYVPERTRLELYVASFSNNGAQVDNNLKLCAMDTKQLHSKVCVIELNIVNTKQLHQIVQVWVVVCGFVTKTTASDTLCTAFWLRPPPDRARRQAEASS